VNVPDPRAYLVRLMPSPFLQSLRHRGTTPPMNVGGQALDERPEVIDLESKEHEM
jgi:hypothetical protein